MKAKVEVSSYIEGRYNSAKLEKLKAALEKEFKSINIHDSEVGLLPEEGIKVTISMSAKYQTPYVMVENWGSFLRVGKFEDAVKDALDARGFEVTEEGDDEDRLKISFE